LQPSAGSLFLKRLTYFVPGKPIAFARAGSHGTRRYTPKLQADYMKAIQSEYLVMRNQVMIPGIVYWFVGPIRMTIEAVFRTPKGKKPGWKASRCDLDNILKIHCDALNCLAYQDDGQICELIARKTYGLGEGVTVTIEELE
jgi:Holliday junction resolvase RusA-like endonuclease